METCIVGCKLPHGLDIDLDVKKDDKGVMIDSKRMTLKGANAVRILGGYGVTRGVPKASFLQWLKDHATTPFILNGSVFMVTDEASARDRAKEGGDATGLEQIDPLKSKKATGLQPLGEDDKAAAQALAAQRAENPLRHRQIDELQTEQQ